MLANSSQSFSLEKTAVLPKGVRSVSVRQIHTTVREKYNMGGTKDPIAKPLNKNLTFGDIVKKESGDKKLLLKSFLDRYNLNLTDSAGQFKGDMAARVRVTVPLISYGLTDNLTIAAAFPIYQAHSSVKVGFETSQKADDFIAYLSGKNSNKGRAAKDAAYKLSNAVDGLQDKLAENGYQPLKNWEGAGLGDIVLAMKYRFYNESFLKAASSMGFTLPTGRVSDPDILNDVPFGTGAVSFFTSLISDQFITDWFFLNEYVKGTFNFGHVSSVRLKTAEESIAVSKEGVRTLLGNKLEAGLSAQVDTFFGLIGGFGYVYERKLADQYYLEKNLEAKKELEKNTDYFTNHLVAKVGYSSIKAYKQKKIPLPLVASVEYKKQIRSKNASVKDLLTFEISFFF